MAPGGRCFLVCRHPRCPTLCILFCLVSCVEDQSPAAASTGAASPVHWTYEGEEGPEHWAKLSPVYAICAQGHAQSPVDLIASQQSNAIPLIFDYRKSQLKIAHHENVTDIIDNGHTIQISVDAGSTLTTRRDIYNLAQFHFHTPSEHTIGGSSFPMEGHYVHQSSNGNFAVVAAFLKRVSPMRIWRN